MGTGRCTGIKTLFSQQAICLNLLFNKAKRLFSDLIRFHTVGNADIFQFLVYQLIPYLIEFVIFLNHLIIVGIIGTEHPVQRGHYRGNSRNRTHCASDNITRHDLPEPGCRLS